MTSKFVQDTDAIEVVSDAVTDPITQAVGPQCPARHPGGERCERVAKHDGSHVLQYAGGGSSGWTDDTFSRADERKAAGKGRRGPVDPRYEMAEDLCRTCGAHVGFGLRALHLQDCGRHPKKGRG